jgi:hypothetical protein
MRQVICLWFIVSIVVTSFSPSPVNAEWMWSQKMPTSVPEQIGFSTDLTFGTGLGQSSSSLTWDVDALFAVQNSIVLDAFVGIGGLILPGAIRTSDYDEPGDDSFGRFDYGIALLVRPIAFRKSQSSHWSYPFLGLRWIAHKGLGQTEKALDCLRCSNVSESYHRGDNAFLEAGLVWRNAIFRLDYRLTEREGFRKVEAYDPYNVGSDYEYTQGPYVESRIILSVGYQWLWDLPGEPKSSSQTSAVHGIALGAEGMPQTTDGSETVREPESLEGDPGSVARVRFAQATLNVRSGRGIEFEIVRVLRRGERVRVAYLLDGWVALFEPQRPYVLGSAPLGFISERHLGKAPPPPVQKPVEHDPGTESDILYAQTALNVRSGRSSKHDIVGRLERGERVRGGYSLNGWLAVFESWPPTREPAARNRRRSTIGPIGYVSAKYLAVSRPPPLPVTGPATQPRQWTDSVKRQGSSSFMDHSYRWTEGDGKYAVTYEPPLPRNDGIVVGAMLHTISSIWGKHQVTELSPDVIPRGGTNLVRFHGVGQDFLFLIVKNTTGEVHSFVITTE